jgi:hypothetical protein
MKIEVNLEKKYAFAILSVLLLIGVSVFAYTYTSQIPNPGHGSDTVWISINGTEMTLQDAITNGKFSNGVTNIINGVIDGVTFTYFCYDNYGLSPVCTNAGGTQGYCPAGFTQKLALGNFGVCWATGNARMDFFMSPGGTCNSIGGAVGGRAFVCSNQTSSSTPVTPAARINYSDCTLVGGVKASCGMNCPSGYVMTGFQTGASCGYPPAAGDTLYQSSMTCCKLI